MTSYRNMKFASKVLLHLMITSTLALLMAMVVIITSNWFHYRQTRVESLLSQADVISTHSIAAMRFEDSGAGAETLRSLSAVPGVEAAYLVRSNGETFASYVAGDSLETAVSPDIVPGYRFQGKSLILVREIIDEGERLGTLSLYYDMASFYDQSSRMIGLAILTGIMAILIAVAIAYRLLKALMRPIIQLAKTAATISKKADYTVRAERVYEDEVGELTDAFNNMIDEIQDRDAKLAASRDNLEDTVAERTAELQSTQEELMATARQAGMAEVASDVLHNVGNVLNSVGIACAVVLEKTQGSKIKNVEKTADLLDDNADQLAVFLTSDPRGRKLPQYLSKLSQHLLEEQQEMIVLLRELERHIVHIKTIINVQQSISRVGSVIEQVNIEDIIIDAVKLSEASLKSRNIKLQKIIGEVEPAWVDRHKLLQILTNLLTNAKQAIDEAVIAKPMLKLELTRYDDGFFEISVSDNGIGIEKENISRVFRHGFTTKADGHGFGLHASANNAQQMGGFLTAHSEGKDEGARFTLRLPLKHEAA